MNSCKIVEDLLPLYEEGLVQAETAQWIEQHLASCASCSSVTNIEMPTPEPIRPEMTAEKTIAKTKLKLAVYQMLFVALSFIFAMSTAIFTEKGFGFILSYFLLGAVTYGFYRSWLFTIALSLVPIFIWTMFDTILTYSSVSAWWNESLHYYSPVGVIIQLLFGGVLTAVIHTLFAALGAAFIVLIQKAFQREESA